MIDFLQPKIMGILNITPDSFSDGGLYLKEENAESRIQELMKAEVDIIDVGGESTGPNSKDVSEEEELSRIKPIVDLISQKKWHEHCLFSIDTYKSRIAEYALQNGFAMINDVTALRGDPRMIDVLLKYKPYVILMYSKDPTPRTSKAATEYQDVIKAIKGFLSLRVYQLVHAGFPKEKIILDPGLGMFVSADPKYSFEIIERLEELKDLGYPLCIGPSRKSFVGDESIAERDKKSWKIAQKALANGASLVRMHAIKNGCLIT